MAALAELSDSVPVTLIITRTVAPGHERDFQAWLRYGMLLAAGFPGFLGAGTLASSAGGDRYQVMMRFSDAGHLACWERSLSRRMWLDRGEALVCCSEWQRLDGLDLIFGRPQAERQPPRWKRAVSVWLFLFPVALSLNTLALSMLPELPVVLRVMLTTAIQVPLMIYAGAPLMQRLLRRWLLGPAAAEPAGSLRGA